MKEASLEAFLGRLYADPAAQVRFRLNPVAEARSAGLSEEECNSLIEMDWEGFEMACRSFERKRNQKMSGNARSFSARVWRKAKSIADF